MELKKLNKKGQLGLDVVRSTIIFLLIIAVFVVASTLALVSLRDSGVFTTSSLEANYTSAIVANVSTAGSDFFANAQTIFSILVVVVIISAIAIVILVVRRFGGGGGGL